MAQAERDRRLTVAERERLVPVVIRFPPDLHDAIKRVAAAEDRSVAATVRRALRQYADRAAMSTDGEGTNDGR